MRIAYTKDVYRDGLMILHGKEDIPLLGLRSAQTTETLWPTISERLSTMAAYNVD